MQNFVLAGITKVLWIVLLYLNLQLLSLGNGIKLTMLKEMR